MIKLFPLIVFLAFAKSALACSCNYSPLDLPVKEIGLNKTQSVGIGYEVDLIFNAILINYSEIIQDKDNYPYREMTFRVLTYYKGNAGEIIKVKTNATRDACGFIAKENTACLIFTSKKNGDYYTYRSDCCRSASAEYDKEKYDTYLRFLEAVTKKIDGSYVFQQEGIDHPYKDSAEILRFTIKDGQFDGQWVLVDRAETVLEAGFYAKGKEIGEWYIYSKQESTHCNGCSKYVQEERIYNDDGIIIRSVIKITDKSLNWEGYENYDLIKNHYIIWRKEIIVDGKTQSVIEYEKDGTIKSERKY